MIEQLPRIESTDQSTAAQFRTQLERLQRVLLYPLADRLHTPFNSNDLDSHERIKTLRLVATTPDLETEGSGSGKSLQSRLMSMRNPQGGSHATGKYNTLGSRSGAGTSSVSGNASGSNLKLLANIDLDAPVPPAAASDGVGGTTTSTLPRPSAAHRSVRLPKKQQSESSASTAVLENLDIAGVGALSASGSSEALVDNSGSPVMRVRPEDTELKKLGFKVFDSLTTSTHFTLSIQSNTLTCICGAQCFRLDGRMPHSLLSILYTCSYSSSINNGNFL